MVYFSLFLAHNKLYKENKYKLIVMFVTWLGLVVLWNVGAHMLEG